MTFSDYIPIFLFGAGVLLAVYGFVYRMDKRVSTMEFRCKSHQPTIDSIAQLNSRLDKIAADQELFWKILGPHLAGIIHSPTAHDRDELVDKLFYDTENLTEDDLEQLVSLLDAALHRPGWSEEKRLVGALVLTRAHTLLSQKQSLERRVD